MGFLWDKLNSYAKNAIFWNITPCVPLSDNRSFGGKYRIHLQEEAICSSETSVDIQRTERRYIPEDGTFPKHRCENLKSYMNFYIFLQELHCVLLMHLCLPKFITITPLLPEPPNYFETLYNSILIQKIIIPRTLY
jgi:hypothetical protein